MMQKLEMEIHPAKKTHTHKLYRQACLMPECIEGQTEFNSVKNEEDC